jgi:phosphatidylglycerol---prolipoprotein diacylglyceryl transferase
MHPIAFTISVPEFLQGILPAHIAFPSYGILVVVGAISAWRFLWLNRRSVAVDSETIAAIVLISIVGSFVGGKLFFFLEEPFKYLRSPVLIVQALGHGFVFFGSFLCAVALLLFFFVRRNIPALPMFDLIAVAGCLVQACGKIGCLLAGCCYGRVTTSALGIVFEDPRCQARPLNTPLLPVQVLDFLMLVLILSTLVYFHTRRHFSGQLILLYAALYSVGRCFTEMLRGDSHRGFVFDGLLSHSQAIALIIAIASIPLWIVWSRREASSDSAAAAGDPSLTRSASTAGEEAHDAHG